jgi:hypothetical protein
MRSVILAAIVFLGTLGCPTSMTAAAGTTSNEIARNPIGLPAYPNLWKASVTGGAKGVATLYEAATHDAYETVLASYRSGLTGASEEKSGYVKELVRLPHGKSVTVCRSENDNSLIALGMDAR